MTPNTKQLTAIDMALLSLRVVAGSIFVLHGAQKVFGALDGPGLSAVVQQMGPIGYLVSLGELLGGLGLIVGLLTRFSAAANIVIMLGAIAMVHGKNGFFSQGGGYELNLALIGLLLPLLIAGPGLLAISNFIRLPFGGAANPVTV
jgi:putative oxidoreductase